MNEYYYDAVSEDKGFGQRFCKRTLNPKTGRWCAPKYGTYNLVAIVCHDWDKTITSYVGLSQYTSDEVINGFLAKHKDRLSDFQRLQIDNAKARNEILSGVKYECVVTGTFCNAVERII